MVTSAMVIETPKESATSWAFVAGSNSPESEACNVGKKHGQPGRDFAIDEIDGLVQIRFHVADIVASRDEDPR